MSQDTERREGARLKRTEAVVRAWDGPNSRIALELDLDQMPWGPFESLGRRMTLMVPSAAEPEDGDGGGESQLESALKHVEHAAERCAEFSRLGNGSEQIWKGSQRTWEWLRGHLTRLWMDQGETEEPVASPPTSSLDISVPHMPGAAATLEVVARALRSMPLDRWYEAAGGRSGDAPTREEAIQTLQGVARLMSAPTRPSPPRETAPREPAPAPITAAPEREPVEDELSFDFAAGYDEGYQMGRRVGRALATRALQEGRGATIRPR